MLSVRSTAFLVCISMMDTRLAPPPTVAAALTSAGTGVHAHACSHVHACADVRSWHGPGGVARGQAKR